MNKNYTALNGILIYTIAALLTLIIHEAGHFIVEKSWGFDAVMHPNYGSYSGVASNTQKIIIAAAGPLVSFLQGLIFLFITTRKIKKNLFSLFSLWFSLHGFILFFGYLVCSPFFIYGDTGQVFYLLHFSIYVTIIVSIAGIFLLVKTLDKVAKNFNSYGQDTTNPKSQLNELILYPLIFGGLLSLLLELPVPNLLLLFAGVTTPLMFLIVYGKLKITSIAYPRVRLNKLSIPLLVIFALTIFIVRLLV